VSEALEKRVDLSFLSFVTGNAAALHAELRGACVRSARTNDGTSPPDRNRIVGFVNPHVFNTACDDADVRRFLHAADLLCVDGLGIQLAVLATRGRWLPRCVAEHVFRRLVETLDVATDAVLIGTTREEVERAARAINTASPALNVVATLDGFADDDDARRFLRRHHAVPLVLIGAGSPKSERLALLADTPRRGATIFHIGGGTIKTWAGTKRRAPALVSRLGLEWLHRLVLEPHTRHRYTIGGLKFIGHLLRRRRGDDQIA